MTPKAWVRKLKDFCAFARKKTGMNGDRGWAASESGKVDSYFLIFFKFFLI